MIYLIYFVLLFMFPILLSVLFNVIIDKMEISKLKSDLKYIYNILLEIIKIIFIVFLVQTLLRDENVTDSAMEAMMINIVYFSMLFSFVISLNYFGTRYLKFKICIKVFLNEIVKFFRDNFILNILFFTLLIYIRKNNDLMIGLIGSYFFFALTTVHNGYKQNINENNKNFSFIYKIMQIILNIFIIISFVSIEKIINQYSQGQPIFLDFKYILYELLLVGVIIINLFLPQIENFGKRINILKRRKTKK